MKAVEIAINQLKQVPWNPNVMGTRMLSRLKRSIEKYGLVENLVVRRLNDDTYEVLSGNQRLEAIKALGFQVAPCVVVNLNDPQAKLLAQALNRIEGQDDIGLKAELLRSILKELPQEAVLELLPETAESLQALPLGLKT